MPGESSGTASGSGSGDAAHHRRVFMMGCLIPLLAMLVGAASLGLHYVIDSPASPYQVSFSPSGKACDNEPEANAALDLDEDSGELLSCGFPGMPGGDDTRYVGTAFSAAEIAQVTALSRRLGSDGEMTEADRAAVNELVVQISRAHGWTKMSPTWLENLTWWLGLGGLIGGVALLMVVGLWARHTESEPPLIEKDGIAP